MYSSIIICICVILLMIKIARDHKKAMDELIEKYGKDKSDDMV